MEGINVLEFRTKYESRTKNIHSTADRVQILGDLSEDFERLVRAQPYNRNDLYEIKRDVERRCDIALLN